MHGPIASSKAKSKLGPGGYAGAGGVDRSERRVMNEQAGL
jgi:hypothetical protein